MVKSAERVAGSVAPFLTKCYDMVDDESSDDVISWSESSDSFVIWDVTQFSLRLLPLYFKHSNFSSFMRQLNIYGFRKVDSDSWVFANEGFLRGQKHLLKSISRKKNSHAPQEQRKAMEVVESVPEESPEKAENNLWKEVENLKIDKNALTQELVKLRQHQETSNRSLIVLGDQLQGMEKNQQQMLSFLVMAMQYPGYFVKRIKSKENNWRILESSDDEMSVASEGAMVKYQPPADAAPASEESTEFDFCMDGTQDFFTNPDFLKLLMDEKPPLIRPEWTDDGTWEQYLLSSPRGNAEDSRGEGKNNTDTLMTDEDPVGEDTENTDTRMSDESAYLETLLAHYRDLDSRKLTGNSPNRGIEPAIREANAMKTRKMDALTRKLGLLGP